MKKAKKILKELIPSSYDIFLDVDFSEGKFKGKTVISARLIQDSVKLLLHAEELKISSAKVITSETEFKADSFELDDKETVLKLNFSDKVPAGDIEIEIEYTANCSEDMLGFYIAKSPGQKNSHILSTQLASHYARRVFPSIDEPSAKAIFCLTVKSQKDIDIIANTPVKKREINGTKQTVEFEPTPKMSTYLLAWALGEFEMKETTSKNDVLIRTVATKGNIEKCNFALKTAKEMLDFYEDYFEIEYPLPKLDLFAVPEFSAGAMENWGLITFREETLFVDENTSVTTKQFVAKVIAHELAHQWFGNLVTMKWWNDLWLNEGFASWIEYLAVDYIFPEWDIWTDFVSSDWDTALQLDSLLNTHPIEVPINHPSEINEIFDAISYQKGASCIRMLNDFVGQVNFQKGLNEYLKRHKYSNTTTDDLWEALEEVSEKPVKKFMHAWTSQPGYPKISYRETENGLKIKQERFLLNPNIKNEAEDLTWPIKLTDFNNENELYINEKTKSWNLTLKDLPKLNHNQIGLYRINYNKNGLVKLKKAVKSKKLHSIDRLGVLSDVFATTRAGDNNLSDLLELLHGYDSENDPAVWDVISYSMNILWRIFDSDELRGSLKNEYNQILDTSYGQVNWDIDKNKYKERLLRATILGLSMKFEVEDARTKALGLFDRLNDGESIHPDIRRGVYVTAARERGNAVYDAMLKMYKAESSYEERSRISNALASINDKESVQKNLKLLRSDDVRLQEIISWLAFLFNNRDAKEQTWVWVKNNWDWLKDNFGSGIYLSRVPKLAGYVFTEQTKIDDIREFFNSRDLDGIERNVKQALEVAEANKLFKERGINELNI